ncbi:hypothetical protein E2K93_15935 [Thalassotalea sp. HSM 43]|uniref:hypothetical protein n=1 Tax=Thalassotalea sp. HSM 43 TaxID=2552945 RepID=UPI0010806E9B|nr:hypothetical protein [Thalassotalea sp. HSM 43]QBY05759.1 hypothetical protein E2K93_15935 [Thalassotalea sp. HSM 43]
MKQLNKIIVVIALLCSVSGCMSASEHKNDVDEAVNGNNANKLTVGVVQKEIKLGMAGADVAAILGSPNIVSTDKERNEVWVYDKIATEFAYSNSSGGISTLILGFGSEVLAGGGGGYNKNAGAASRTSKTLTIIIRFDEGNFVNDFAYHSSTF